MVRRLAPSLAALLVLQCAALPELEPNMCGNGVIEGGEDCDLFPDDALGSNLTCGEQCRYVCDPSAPTCPAGYSCGADGVCRFSEGAFADSDPARPLAARELFLEDVDGDGRLDLLGADVDTVEARFGDADGTFGAPVGLSTTFPTGPRRVARLDGDAGADLVSVHAEGLELLLGRPGRVLEPVGALSFPSSAFAPAAAASPRLYALRAEGRRVDDLVTVYVDGGAAYAVGPAGPPVQLVDVAGGLVSDLAAGALEPGQIALPVAAVGGDRVDLVRAVCAAPGDCARGPVRAERVTSIDLGPLATVGEGGAAIQDLDGDGLGDLVVQGRARIDDAPTLVWARRRPEGDFEAARRFGPADRRCRDLAEPCAPFPLALGDFDGDGDADFVYPDGVYLNEDGLELVYPPLIESWGAARFVDLDGDGQLDVAATSRRRPLLQIVRNALPNLDTIIFDVGTSVQAILTADFDGDGIDDVALRQDDLPNGGAGIAVTFGSRDGRLLEPARMVTFPRIDAWTAGVLPSRTLPADDGLADIVVQARQAGADRVGFVLGSARRQLSAPVALPAEGPTSLAPIPTLALGLPSAASPDLDDLLVFTLGGPVFRFSRDGAGLSTPDAERYGVQGSCLEPADVAGGCVQAVAVADDSVVIVNRSPTCGLDLSNVPLRLTRLTLRAEGLDCARLSTAGLPDAGGGRVVLRADDLDGDGVPQVIVLLSPAEARGGLAVWPQGGEAPRFLEAPTEDALLDVTIVNVDASAAREAAVLTERGLWLADLVGQAGFAPDPTVSLAPDQRRRAARLVGADLDRDGLDDLVLAGGDRVWVFRAREAWRGGPPPSATLTSAP